MACFGTSNGSRRRRREGADPPLLQDALLTQQIGRVADTKTDAVDVPETTGPIIAPAQRRGHRSRTKTHEVAALATMFVFLPDIRTGILCTRSYGRLNR